MRLEFKRSSQSSDNAHDYAKSITEHFFPSFPFHSFTVFILLPPIPSFYLTRFSFARYTLSCLFCVVEWSLLSQNFYSESGDDNNNNNKIRETTTQLLMDIKNISRNTLDWTDWLSIHPWMPLMTMLCCCAHIIMIEQKKVHNFIFVLYHMALHSPKTKWIVIYERYSLMFTYNDGPTHELVEKNQMEFLLQNLPRRRLISAALFRSNLCKWNWAKSLSFLIDIFIGWN